MKIFLIRHGQTTGDVEDRYGGWYDDHLSPQGILQAKKLAKILKGHGIEIVYHSQFIRATETALHIANALKIPMVSVDGLKERDKYAMMSGMLKSEAKIKYPEEMLELARGHNSNVTESETYEHLKKRVADAFGKILADKYHTVAIITHGGPIKSVMRDIMKIGEPENDIADCGFLEIVYEKNKLILLNKDNLF